MMFGRGRPVDENKKEESEKLCLHRDISMVNKARAFSKYFCSVLGKKADKMFTSWNVLSFQGEG